MKARSKLAAGSGAGLWAWVLACCVLGPSCSPGGGGSSGGGGAPPPANAAPVADAGPDQSVLLASGATLAGSATDDGLPAPPAAVTLAWTRVSGPGTATFANPASGSTTVGFSAAGGYVLRLTADDGALSASDDVTVTVTSAPVSPTITTHPADRHVTVGMPATFTVVAAGTAPLSYQWQRNGTDISGATSASYTTPATVLADDQSTFRVRVANAQGNVTSNSATLWVHPVSTTCCTTPHDTIPQFAAAPTIQSARTGPWSDPNTWNPARLPTATDVVGVSAGTIVTYDTMTGQARTIGIKAGGTLSFRTDRSTRLQVGTLVVEPVGSLEVGTAAAPVGAGFLAEIVIANQALDTAFDPRQFGTGIVGLGTVRMHGAVLAPTFVRLAQEPAAGATTLTLAQPVTGWRAGDRIFVPDSRHLLESEKWANYVPQWDERTIQSISADGRTVTLGSALQFAHPGARDGAGVLNFLPHAANLSRNVVVRSENPAGTRGHVLFTFRADVDVRYAQFQDLGRTTNADVDNTTFDASGNVTHVGTNQMGRYALHAHHLWGPVNATNTGYQFRFVGNAVADSTKWPITIHSSHYGLIQGNVVVDGTGSGIVTEDGDESENEFAGNFGAAIRGDVNPRNTDGRDGSVFWFRGFNHILRDNVAANGINGSQGIVTGSGYNFMWPPASRADTAIPLFRGADTHGGQAGVDYRLVNMQLMPIREFARNEAYGATATGLVVWNLGSDGGEVPAATQTTTIRDFTAWHLHEEAYFGYPAKNMVFDGFVVRGHTRVQSTGLGAGWVSGDYYAGNMTIRRADIQGVVTGVGGSTNNTGTMTIENSYFRTYGTAIGPETLKTPGGGSPDSILPRRWVIRNVRFDAWPGRPLRSIEMNYFIGNGKANLILADEVFVYDYQGVSGRNFRVYYREQAPSFILPQTSYDTQYSPPLLIIRGSPVAGLTNQQNWAQYGVAFAGSVSPTVDDTTHPEIDGFTIPIP